MLTNERYFRCSKLVQAHKLCTPDELDTGVRVDQAEYKEVVVSRINMLGLGILDSGMRAKQDLDTRAKQDLGILDEKPDMDVLKLALELVRVS